MKRNSMKRVVTTTLKGMDLLRLYRSALADMGFSYKITTSPCDEGIEVSMQSDVCWYIGRGATEEEAATNCIADLLAYCIGNTEDVLTREMKRSCS